MKKYLSVMPMLLLWTLPLTGFTQTNYCLPLEKARLLVEDAYKKRVLDTVVNVQAQQIELMNRHNISTYNDFQKLLQVEKQKLTLQREITSHTEGLISSYSEENKSLKKQIRRLKWQRVGLGAIAVLVIGVSL